MKLSSLSAVRLNSKGIAHYMIPMLIVLLVGIGGAYSLVASHADSLTPAQKSALAQKKKAAARKGNHGTVIVYAQRQMINSKGKKVMTRAAGVRVELLSTAIKARCRDAAKVYKPRAGVVFSAKTSANDKIAAHKPNIGTFTADSCSTGKYLIRPVLDANYQIVKAPATMLVRKGKTTKVVITIVKKTSPTLTGVAASGSQQAQGAPGNVSTDPDSEIYDDPGAPQSEDDPSVDEDASYDLESEEGVDPGYPDDSIDIPYGDQAR
ncbi:MAG: hypothetical protein JWO35_32 [Candidatus Saccharibacteria bacterium]|nr:hypothetical protein [Candidatus Saccharibacteria bacterium]